MGPMPTAETILALVAAGDGQVVAEPPGTGEGYWAGGPSAVFRDGTYWLAYRLRRPVDNGRGYANVIARSEDGVHFETVATVTSEQFDSASLERPALVPLPDGSWRLYVSAATTGTKHWWVEALDAPTPAELPEGKRTLVLPGDEATVAWKDVVVHHSETNGGSPGGAGVGAGGGWQLWACRHPLDGGDQEADRMTSHYFTSDDGLTWDEAGAALTPTAGTWNARGTRIASVISDAGRWIAFYDGRASADENWHERTGYAVGRTPGRFTATAGPTPAGHTARYVSVATLPPGSSHAATGGLRVYWEASRADGSHDLRTAYVPRPESDSQS